MIDGFPVFYHWTPAKLKGIGPMGWWMELYDGSTALVPNVGGRPLSECVGPNPIDKPNPCPRCGWVGKTITWREYVQARAL